MESTIPFLTKKETLTLLKQKCEDYGLDYSAFEELIKLEFKMMGKQRKKGMYDSFDDILARIYKEDLN